jgi:diguanylate cyclase
VILENVQLQGSVQRSATEIAELRREALTDMLTGLPNRRSFESRLEEELRRAARYSHVFSLVMIDLDNFKRINDQYGHHVGDVALQDIARCLRHKVRATDFLARFGGDEFVLLLPETTAAAAQAVCAKLYASMAGCAIGWGKADESLTFSYGIAEYPQDGQAASLLVGAADRAMYGEKGKSEAPALGV